jgi:hypothetical protein
MGTAVISARTRTAAIGPENELSLRSLVSW